MVLKETLERVAEVWEPIHRRILLDLTTISRPTREPSRDSHKENSTLRRVMPIGVDSSEAEGSDGHATRPGYGTHTEMASHSLSAEMVDSLQQFWYSAPSGFE